MSLYIDQRQHIRCDLLFEKITKNKNLCEKEKKIMSYRSWSILHKIATLTPQCHTSALVFSRYWTITHV